MCYDPFCPDPYCDCDAEGDESDDFAEDDEYIEWMIKRATAEHERRQGEDE